MNLLNRARGGNDGLGLPMASNSPSHRFSLKRSPNDGSARSINTAAPLSVQWKRASTAKRVTYILTATFLLLTLYGYRHLRYYNTSIHLNCQAAECTLSLVPVGRSGKVKLTLGRSQVVDAYAVKTTYEGDFVSARPNLHEDVVASNKGKKKKKKQNTYSYKGPDDNGHYTSYAIVLQDKEATLQGGDVADEERASLIPLDALEKFGTIDDETGHYRLIVRKFKKGLTKRRVRTMVQKIESYLKRRRQKLLVKESAPPSWVAILCLVLGIVGFLLTVLVGQFSDDLGPARGPGVRRGDSSRRVGTMTRQTPAQYEVDPVDVIKRSTDRRSREPHKFCSIENHMVHECHLVVRSKTALEIYPVPEHNDDAVGKGVVLLEGATSLMEMGPDGRYAYCHVAGVGIVRVDLHSHKLQNNEVFLKDSVGVQMLHVSPQGNFLLTWERFSQDKPNNLKVWEAMTGKMVAAFSQKNLKRESWPYLQWSHDEVYAFLMATNEVQVFPQFNILKDDETRYTDKLRIPGISTLSVPTHNVKGDYLLTSFCHATKDKPARAGLHQYKPGATVAKNANYPALLSKSLFQAEEMKTRWNSQGDAALITLQTSVDASGQSYYGSSQLFLLAQGLPDAQQVPLPQEGPVQDVGWIPDPEKPPCFVVVAGKMPAMASLHHGQTGKATFLFGNQHRNTVCWSPHGRFLCLAGFGNLAGGMSFWDKNKEKLIPGQLNLAEELRAEATVGFGWAPSSRVFASSTCSPRMNVDNGVRLFRYNGDEVTNVPWNNDNYKPDKLLEARFVPSLPKVFPDRPQSPPPEGLEKVAAAAPSAPKVLGGKYVPPSARGRAGRGTSLAERMRAEKMGKMQSAGKVAADKPVAATSVTGRVIPGMTQEAQGKSKSAIKREKAKLKKQQQEEEDRKKKEMEDKLQAEQAAESVDPEKRARKIKKTLKQIDDLKAKDPSSLNNDQKTKIASEESLREELANLGL